MGSHGKVYTLAEVSTHNTHKDCWLVINGKDVTEWGSEPARTIM